MLNWIPEYWDVVRRRGRKDYIVALVVRQAIPTAVVCWSLFVLMLPVYFERRHTPDTAYLASGEFWVLTFTAAVAFPLAGVLRGVWLWRRNERRFGRERQKRVSD